MRSLKKTLRNRALLEVEPVMRRKPFNQIRWILRSQRGSTTVTAAFMVAAIVVLAMVSVTSGVGLVQQHQAAVAADVTALAAAMAAESGMSPCHRAQEIADVNDAQLRQCVSGIDGTEDVQVTVVKRGKEAIARAGPA